MKCLVTGAAGFIGSHLCEQLLAAGHDVLGIDAFIPYYPRALKEANIAPLYASPRFQFAEHDLREGISPLMLEGTQAIFHLAAVPGLPRSWSEYGLYETCNLRATQKLVSSAVKVPTLKKFILASTSSVYGKYAQGDETVRKSPVSPYGVTKFAAECLAQAYEDAEGLPLVILRYFSVYGPRQRPDMAYNRFIQAFLMNQPITIYGDGSQVRGNTFVTDCVSATMAALNADAGTIYNVGGGETASTLGIVHKLENLFQYSVPIRFEEPRKGDQQQTGADTTRLRADLSWEPRVSLSEGLRRQIDWQRAQVQPKTRKLVAA